MGDSDDDFDKRRNRDKFRRERSNKDYDNEYERSRDKTDADKNRNSWTNSGNRARSDRNRSDSNRPRYSPNRSRDYSPPPAKRSRHDTWDDAASPAMPQQTAPPLPLMQQQVDFMPGGPPHPHWQMQHDPMFHMSGGGGGGGGGGMYPNQFVPNNNSNSNSNVHMQSQQSRQHQTPGHEDTSGHTVIMTFKQFIINEPDDICDDAGVQKYRNYKYTVRGKQICDFFSQHKSEEWFRIKYHPEESLNRENELRRALQKRKSTYEELRERGVLDGVSFDLVKATQLERVLNSGVVLMEGGERIDLDVVDAEIKAELVAREKRLEAAANLKKLKIQKLAEEQEKVKKREEAERESREKAEKLANNSDLDNDEDEEAEMKEKEDRETDEERDEGIDTELSNGKEYDDETASDNKGNDLKTDENDKPTELELDDGQLSEIDDIPEKNKEDANKVEIESEKDSDVSILHKTQSIFLRNLSPDITKREVEAMCKKFEGYKRVAIQDPQADRKFYRRGWVTFESNVNIKDICLSLTNIRLRECEMGAIINRELKQRIRPVSGIVSHKTIAIQDLKNAIAIIKNYDNKWKIWNPNALKRQKILGEDDLVEGEQPADGQDDSEEVILDEYENANQSNDLIIEANKFLKSIDQNPVDEEEVVMMTNDSQLIMHLDKLLMYLRIVYSFDYFAAVEYPNEDEMPNRCGILHARATLPVNKLNRSDIKEWITSFELRINPFINMSSKINELDAIKLGKKDKKSEVEKFVKVNSDEIDKDKWLCPLSGKKFKGPDFIRKHIFNKHADKVEFFNNFLYDINRPGLPEMAPQSGRTATFRNQQVNPNFNPRRSQPMQPPQRNPMIRPFSAPRGDMWRPRMDRRMDTRPIICYNDLDAPQD